MGRAAPHLLIIRKKEDEEEWRQASSIRSQIGQGARCDACRNDVGIIRETDSFLGCAAERVLYQ